MARELSRANAAGNALRMSAWQRKCAGARAQERMRAHAARAEFSQRKKSICEQCRTQRSMLGGAEWNRL
jgi:hypothetical protein